ncbi:hypothetical protein ECH_0360 [Ehrlichia chaffeensis str. Arkansas]|uniref:Uncharacterized protein n=1 Tax=Ehrlichia chaffeensis (strain ATCC CRL-10679 / Arkansas) TaxID=205920 RepID=Q2GHA3_EHRCR|nr:hypothetical protein ECH_0360 [Ehrlichia chaffeensis str. Arkansas]
MLNTKIMVVILLKLSIKLHSNIKFLYHKLLKDIK